GRVEALDGDELVGAVLGGPEDHARDVGAGVDALGADAGEGGGGIDGGDGVHEGRPAGKLDDHDALRAADLDGGLREDGAVFGGPGCRQVAAEKERADLGGGGDAD